MFLAPVGGALENLARFDDGLATAGAWAKRFRVACLRLHMVLPHRGPRVGRDARGEVAEFRFDPRGVGVVVLDLREPAFHVGGQGHVLETRRDHVDQGLPLHGGAQLLALAFHVSGADQLLDHVGPGGRGADAAGMGFVVVQRGLEFLVLHPAARVFHRGEQRRLGERLRRLRLPLGQRRPALRDGRDGDSGGEVRGDDVARGLIIVILVFLRCSMLDGAPTEGYGLVGAAGEPAFAFAQAASFVRMFFTPMRIGVRDGQRGVVHVVVAHSLPHAAHHTDQHEAFVLAEFVKHGHASLHGGKDGGMARNLRIVHRQLQARLDRQCARINKTCHKPLAFGKVAQRVQIIVGDVLRVSARIRGQTLLIERLERDEGASCGQAVKSTHVLLQSGQVVQVRRTVAHGLTLHHKDTEREIRSVDKS